MASREEVEKTTITEIVDLSSDDDGADDELTEIKQEVSDTPSMVIDGTDHDIDLGEVKQEYPDHGQQTTRCCDFNAEPTQVKNEDEDTVFHGFEDCEDISLEPLQKRLKLTYLTSGEKNPKIILDETACIEIDGEPDDEVDPLMPIEQATSEQTGGIRQMEPASSGDQNMMGALQLVLSQTQPLQQPIMPPTMDNSCLPTTDGTPFTLGMQPQLVKAVDQASPAGKSSSNQPMKTEQKSKNVQKLVEGPTCCVVDRLIKYHFLNSLRSDEDRQAILKMGRPKTLVFELKTYNTYYCKYPWLAACSQRKAFYCWPCLLFAEQVEWSLGCVSTSAFIIDVRRHQLYPEHQKAQQRLLYWKPINGSSLINTLVVTKLNEACWSQEDRRKIIRQGRPCPILVGKTCSPTIRTEHDQKLFFEELYSNIKWITGCTTDGKFYCWPCILFGQPWTYGGMLDGMDENFTTAVAEHETAPGHLEANIKLKQLEFQFKEKQETQRKTCVSMGAVMRNRLFVKYLTEVICAENTRLTNNEVTWEDWAGSLKLLATYNVRLGSFIDEKTNSKGADYVDQIITSLGCLVLDSIESAMQEKIKQETENSTFVIFVLDHVSGSTNKNFLSVVIRYIDQNATVVERFFKFTKINHNHVEFMQDIIVRLAEDLDCMSKLVGFTYDGFLVPPRNMELLNEEVRRSCPSARFFHYEEHKLARILEQSLCHLPFCRLLFTVATELAAFFETHSNSAIFRIEREINPNKQTTDIWDTKNGFIATLMGYYSSILEFLRQVKEQQKDWKVAVVVQAESFYDFLIEPINTVLVLLIGGIFKKIETLTSVVDGDRDLKLLKQQEKVFRKAILLMKSTISYNSFVSKACKMLPETAREVADSLKNNHELKKKCCTIVDYAESAVSNRITEMEKAYFRVEYCEMNMKEHLDQRFLLDNKDANTGMTKILIFNELPYNFNRNKLSSELFFSESNEFLRNKFFRDLVKTIKDYDLPSTIPELYKLLQLALLLRPSVNLIPTPVVTKVREYVRNKKDFTTVDGLLWLERDLLTSLQNNPKFYEAVIDRVAEITNAEDFPLTTSER